MPERVYKRKPLTAEQKENISKAIKFENKSVKYVEIRANNKCENPECKDGWPKKGRVKLEPHHIFPKGKDFWRRIYLCPECYRIAEVSLTKTLRAYARERTRSIYWTTFVDYWNDIFIQALQKKKRAAEQYIKKTGKFPRELEEMMNDAEFLKHYQEQNLSPIFEKEILNYIKK